jgi:hypothetical protein
MSQAGILNRASGPLPPSVPTSFVTDSGTAVPVANVLNVVTPGGGTQGIMTSGSGSTITITVTPQDITGSVTTTGAQTLPVITFPLGAVPGVYTFDATIAGFAKSGIGSPLGAGFTIVGSIRTTGAAATLIPTQVVDHFEEGALSAASALLGVSGNNAVINVTGVTDGAAGFVIDWTAFMNYTFAS